MYKEVFETIFFYKKLGEGTSLNKTLLIGKAPHIASEAWLHEIYSPLNKEEISKLEKELDVSFPNEYKAFLELSNGLAFFVTTLSLYGVCRIHSRNSDIREPFNILTYNKDEKPKELNDKCVLIGSYYADGSKLILNTETGEVIRYSLKPFKKSNSWPSFRILLESEVKRIASLFDESGKIKVDLKETLPCPYFL